MSTARVRSRHLRLAGGLLFTGLFLAGSVAGTSLVRRAADQSQKPSTATKAAIRAAHLRLPLSFEANKGQTDSRVKFLSRGPGYTLFLTPDEAVLALAKSRKTETRKGRPGHSSQASVVRMRLAGSQPASRMRGVDQMPGKSNYFPSSDPKTWQTNVPHYGKVRCESVYPGVDLVYYGNQGQLEYDFVVAPGADPRRITLAFQGAEKLGLSAEGDLVLETEDGELRQSKPVVYQEVEGVRRQVEGQYVLRGGEKVGFQVAAFDASKPLVIDPTLVYSTYLGGSGSDAGYGIAVDSSGSAYVTGETDSTDFPTTAGVYQTSHVGTGDDGFVTKFSADGTSLSYSTYFGSGAVAPRAIAVDGDGLAYVTGQGGTVPVTASAFDTTANGSGDAFLLKLSADGSTVDYCTYLGASSSADWGQDIVVASGYAYIVGYTTVNGFPTTTGAYDTSHNGGSDAFIAKIDPDPDQGSAMDDPRDPSDLLYSTFLGGSGDEHGFGIDQLSGEIYVTGRTGSTNFPTVGAVQSTKGGTGSSNDAFVAKLDPAQTGSAQLEYSTYLGGSSPDYGWDIAVDSSGNAYVTGETNSTAFPTTTGCYQSTYGGSTDVFVTKFNSAGSAHTYSTYIGGDDFDRGYGIAVDGDGKAYITGTTTSSDYPLVSAIDSTDSGYEVIVTKLNASGSALEYSTFLGGTSSDQGESIALDSSGNAYVTGYSLATNFPTNGTNTAYQSTHAGGGADVIVAKIGP
jgi:beta-propeller repeat-containing protein